MGEIRINIHKNHENKRKNCACICYLIPPGANTSTSAGSNDDLIMITVIVNYNKSEMHKSCKKKTQSPIPLRPFTHKNLSFIFDWKPATASPPPPPGGGGGFVPLSLPLNDIFSQKLAF